MHCDHEYLNFKGIKLSKSRGTAVEVPYFLSRYDPDALRFYLTAVAPETRDTEFSWEDFVERNNNELVATWGNLANRMLSFAYKRFDGHVPEPGELDDEDRKLLAQVEAGFDTVGELYNDWHSSPIGHLPYIPNTGIMDNARPSFSAKSRFAQQSLQPSLESHYVAASLHINPCSLGAQLRTIFRPIPITYLGLQTERDKE